MTHILVIEDDLDIQELLHDFLQEAGYAVTLAADGIQGYSAFREGSREGAFDLVLLDIMLPKLDGYGVCQLIRKESDVPIIMLTALDSESDQIKGLDCMADDYITKPFSMPVLLRKIAAVLRRSSKDHAQENIIRYQSLVLDINARKVWADGQELALTQREFDLLTELLTHQGRVLTRQMLLNALWKYDFFGDERVVDTHIKNLRKKLNADYIETIRGVGYRIDKAH